MKNLIISILLVLVFNLSSAQNYFQWRGINRTGEYPSENLLRQWPEDGPKRLLLIESLPESYSSVVMENNVMYTTGKEGNDEFLTAIEMDGTIKWNVRYGEPFDGSFTYARTTPTIEGDFAYVISGSGDVACINIIEGKLVWSIDGYKAFNGADGTWGIAESPLIIENKIIYTPGGQLTTMVALDKRTGATIWTSKSLNDNSAYCSPILMEYEGLQTIVTVTASYVIGVNPEDGKLRWKFDYSAVDPPKSGEEINPVTPLVKGNEIFVSSGYNHVGVMLKLAEDQESAELKWKTSDLDNHHGGLVFFDGNIYGSNFSNVASGDWLSINWETGKLNYEADFHGKGSIIISDGLLICYDERGGNVALVNARPEKFDIISTFKIDHGRGPHWSHPTIYEDMLFIRHGSTLGVYRIGG